MILIAATVAFTVVGQLLLKAGMLEVGGWPGEGAEALSYVWSTLGNAKVVSGVALIGIAAATWLAVLSESDISFAYPFMGLSIVLVLALSGTVFGEAVPLTRWVGVAIVCLGLVVATR